MWAGLHLPAGVRQPRRPLAPLHLPHSEARTTTRHFVHVLTHKDLHLHPVPWKAMTRLWGDGQLGGNAALGPIGTACAGAQDASAAAVSAI
jgi:hypothetical protein